MGFAVTGDTTDPPVAGRPPATDDSNARTEDWHGVSPVRATALTQIVQGSFRQRVETTGGGVFLDLVVPRGGVKLGEPHPKCGEFRRRKPANGVLDFSYRTHLTQLTPLGRPAQPGRRLRQRAADGRGDHAQFLHQQGELFRLQ